MRATVAVVAMALLGALVSPVQAADDDARVWLQRMTEALATRNYDGLFTHSTRRQTETMRIVHRVDGEGSTERLVSLDGNGREIIRTPREVHAYLPDRRVVLVEPRTDDGSLLEALPAPGDHLEAHYELRAGKGHRLLGRDVRVIEIRPRDQYRYGYRLWLDEKTAMPLRSEVAGVDGAPLEQMQFTQLEMYKSLAPGAVEPKVDATGFRWMRSNRRVAKSAVAPSGWRPLEVPPGFQLVGTRQQVVPGVAMPVQHLIFSDGFASVSVFIEPGASRAPAPAEASRVGSASTFTTQVRGFVVTAVGEVPPTTVRAIATSLVPSPDTGTQSAATSKR
jgi:sigma-E factor negative regulatory protein RseB